MLKYRQHKRQILGSLMMAFAVMLMISMITYWIPEASVWSNLGGPLGNNISLGLFQLLGLTAFVMPVLMFLWGENQFSEQPIEPLARKSLLIFATTLAISIFLSTLLSDTAAAVVMGVVGYYVLAAMVHYLGRPLTVLILFVPLPVLFIRFILPHIDKTAIKFRLARLLHFVRTTNFKDYINLPRLPKIDRTETPVQALEQTYDLDPRKDIHLKPQAKVQQQDEAFDGEEDDTLNEDDQPVIVNKKSSYPSHFLPGDTTDSDVFDHFNEPSEFELPPLDLLEKPAKHHYRVDKDEVMHIAGLIEENLQHYNVAGKIVEVHPGPVITRYEYKPAPGMKVSRITNLSDDLALVLSAKRVRFQAPVPGKPVVGIEVPNKDTETVFLREILQSKSYKKLDTALPIALGKDTAGVPVVTDLTKMPHLLIAGATGSGKSVCVNTIITSILYRSTPDQAKFLMIDPKMLELSIYNGIPHLHRPVVIDRKDAVTVLKWAVWEMERRYRMLAKVGVRNIKSYNKYVARINQDPHHQIDIFDKNLKKPLPYIVIIIDELADLMMTVANEIEELLARLAQMARAIGIHLILATQRPSVDVITGLIKANFPSRISFQSSSKVDSRTILDQNGAEQLLGNGDMLFLPSTAPEPIRLHGSYISSEETHAIVKFLAEQAGNEYTKYDSIADFEEEFEEFDEATFETTDDDLDDLFDEAKKIVISQQMASVSLLQRRLRVGYARAGRIVDQLHEAGIVGPHEGSKSRQVLVKSFEHQAPAQVETV